jgi:hypothetical protein
VAHPHQRHVRLRYQPEPREDGTRPEAVVVRLDPGWNVRTVAKAIEHAIEDRRDAKFRLLAGGIHVFRCPHKCTNIGILDSGMESEEESTGDQADGWTPEAGE